MRKKDEDELMDSFIEAFGQINNNVGFQMMNQKDFVSQQNAIEDREQINEINRDSQREKPADEDLNWQAQDESTGDKYVLELKKKIQEPDIKDINITFSCLNDKNKYVDSTIDNLCNGRYSHLKNENLKKIAQILCDEYEYIFNYIDASVAQYSDTINSDQAFKVASFAKNKKNMISYVDYNKIVSKLGEEKFNEFNSKLTSAGIKIYYPMNLIKTSNIE